MIREITIQRFKTIRKAELRLSGFNLFAGMNGMGKSSCIQTLLLLRQSRMLAMLPTPGLILRGPLVDVGRGVDAFHQLESPQTICLRIATEGGSASWEFDVLDESEVLPVRTFEHTYASTEQAGDGAEAAFQLPPFCGGFRYLAADRIPPATSYETSHYQVEELRQLGNRGEFAIHYLARYRDIALPISALRHPSLDEVRGDLLSNVAAWLGELSPGISINAESYLGLDKAVLSYNYDAGPLRGFSHPLRPTNVGFGITFALPVVVAVLASAPGDLLLVENPESHLHPSGQARLGRLLALAAAHGVQVIVETHSDHLLNGVRVAVKRRQVAAEDVAIFSFDREPDDPSHAVRVLTPRLDPDGKIDFWPNGFFDEYEKLLYELM